MNYSTILVTMFLAIIIFIVARILIGPLKLFIKLLYSCVISVVGMIIFNFLGVFIGLHIGVNLITVLTVGILGLPGIALLLILQLIF